MLRLFYNVKPCGTNRNLLRSTVEALDNEYIISVEVPGLAKEDLKVTLEEEVLTIAAKRTEDDKEYLLDERFVGELSRSFRLKDLKDGEIKAAYVDGVLKVNVPKLSEAETKKIITIE